MDGKDLQEGLIVECRALLAADTSKMTPSELTFWKHRAEQAVVKIRLLEFIEAVDGQC